MSEVLNNEQMEELAANLNGSHNDLEEGLLALGINIRPTYYPYIEEELAEVEEIERCFLCGYWTFSEALSRNEDLELICSNCTVTLGYED